MDLLTQGAMGAVVAQAASRDRKQVGVATLCGLLAGFAPDLDVLIRSEIDPLLYLEYHRHFSHALIFIPFGAALVAGLLKLIGRQRITLPFRDIWMFCAIGMATHGVLDAATSYGTTLLWPFSDLRVAWSIISIIDPLVTLPIAVLIITGLVKRNARFAQWGVAWVGIYMAFASVQHHRALDVARALAVERGHDPIRVEVKPSFANTLVWRSIYELPDAFYVDAIRTGIAPQVFEGTAISKLDVARDFPWLNPQSQQAKDIDRFAFFSDGFIAQDPIHEDRVIDIRYAFVPNELDALWSIALSPDVLDDTHARYLTHREQARESLGVLWGMIRTDQISR